MGLTVKDISRIEAAIDERLQNAFLRHGFIDKDTQKDLEFARAERIRAEKCKTNRQSIVNAVIVGVSVAILLGLLYNAPALFRYWLNSSQEKKTAIVGNPMP